MATDVGRLSRYLGSIMMERDVGKVGGMKMVPFVTISRQAGAGGHSLAEAILKRMEREKDDPIFQGWQVFDQEICSRILNDPKLSVPLQALLTEEYHNQVADYIMQLMAGTSPQHVVYRRIFKTIRTLALCGKSILVGRGAVCYTRDIPGGIHLRLVAPESVRIRRMERRFSLTEAKAQEMVRTQDASRQRLIRDYFRRDIDDPVLYDAVWNTHSVAMETIASVVVEMIREKMAEIREEAHAAGIGPGSSGGA